MFKVKNFIKLGYVRERQILYIITYMWNQKKMYITKQKQTYRFREKMQLPVGRRKGKGQGRGRGLKGKTPMYGINKIQEYIVQYREYSQYFITTLNEV